MSIAPKVHITIDRLVLNGFEPQQRHALVTALQAELSRQFSRPEHLAALNADRSLANLKLQPFALPAGATPRQIASQSSHQLMHGLTGAHSTGTKAR
jgi:hypothetical protein